MTTTIRNSNSSRAKLTERYHAGDLSDQPIGTCLFAVVGSDDIVQSIVSVPTAEANKKIPIRKLRDGALIINNGGNNVEVLQFPAPRVETAK
jgi:hypothetical protein